MDLAKLVEAIEAATPDGDNLVMLEAAIYTATHPEDNAASWNGPYQHKGVASVVKKGHRGWSEVPRYLRSLDAAVSFVEAALPGWLKSFDELADHTFHAVVAEPPTPPDVFRKFGYGISPTPAIALVLASLRALHTREGRG